MADPTQAPADPAPALPATPAQPAATLLARFAALIIKLDNLNYTFPMVIGAFAAGWAGASLFHRFIW